MESDVFFTLSELSAESGEGVMSSGSLDEALCNISPQSLLLKFTVVLTYFPEQCSESDIYYLRYKILRQQIPEGHYTYLYLH